MLAKIIISLIHFYRWFISPFTRPSCRFTPTCSRYAIHAIEYHGLLKGLWLTIRRLLKCHPYKKLGGSWGYDPVPSHSLKDARPSSRNLMKNIN